MAERRMFAKTIVDSDAFLEMPKSTQNLYFHIGVEAQNKGVIRNIYSICKKLDISMSNVKILEDNKYIYRNGDIFIISHWYENNGIGETARKRNNYT